MSAADTLKAALRCNRITWAELLALPEREALRLPWVGAKVLAEARRKAGDGLIRVEILLTSDQEESLRALGGSAWVREKIEETVVLSEPPETDC